MQNQKVSQLKKLISAKEKWAVYVYGTERPVWLEHGE